LNSICLYFHEKHKIHHNPQYYLKVAPHVKEFYTVLPKYVANYTDFNCGHMAAHYSANKLAADEIHMYGFDSLFDFNMNSVSDINLQSDRGGANNLRLSDNWRPIWQHMFREFPNVKWVLHHTHDRIKVNVDNNVDIVTYNNLNKQKPLDFNNISDA